ncbi:MAG TPA: redoxin domain-containing protein [Phycisphaerae bacterium]|nr:redoxin domain-containing protein [Phycisphaerae bacterium]
MTRLHSVFFVASVLSFVPVLIACDPGTPTTPPDPAEILKQANAAAAKLASISFQAKFQGDGALAAQIPSMDGKVQAKRDSAGTQHRFRVSGTVAGQGIPGTAPFDLAFDGKTLYSVEPGRRVFTSGPVEEGLSVGNPLFQPRFLQNAPFDEELKNSELEYQGVQDVEGVACDVIGARMKGPKASVTKLFLGKEDRLLRRTEMMVQPPSPGGGPSPAGGRIIYTVSGLVQNPDIKDDTFRLECPAGYQPQPLQANRGPQAANQMAGSLPTGSQAPDWEMKTSDGKTVSLKSLRGKVVVMDFWATWCGPCKMSMPSLQKLHERFKDKPVAVYGVNCRERFPGADPMGYIKEKGYTYPQLVNGDKAAEAYKVNGIPAIFIIDPEGKVLFSAAGFNPGMEDALGDIIQKAITKTSKVDAETAKPAASPGVP